MLPAAFEISVVARAPGSTAVKEGPAPGRTLDAGIKASEGIIVVRDAVGRTVVAGAPSPEPGIRRVADEAALGRMVRGFAPSIGTTVVASDPGRTVSADGFAPTAEAIPPAAVGTAEAIPEAAVAAAPSPAVLPPTMVRGLGKIVVAVAPWPRTVVACAARDGTMVVPPERRVVAE